MIRRSRTFVYASVLASTLAAIACSDAALEAVAPTEAVAESRVSTSARWNQRAVALVVARQPAANGQAAVSRILTYLSVAQYRAAAAAKDAQSESKPPSMSAAVGGASVVVLNSFFPLDVAATEAQLNGDLAAPPWPGTSEDAAAGEALGRKIAAAVLVMAASDNYLVTPSPAVPTGPDKWLSSSAAVVRSLYGARPFFLTAANQIRPAAPPAPGSAAFVAALDEVRNFADTRTAAQTALALNWNTSSGPFTAGTLNLVADDLIREKRIGELESARMLATANAAAFDAQIACFDAKFAYWTMRPTQVDEGITMAIPLPNHPSFPSGHSCITGAFMTVLADAVPLEKARMDAMVEEAGMSRVYGGIHYRFDIDAGRDIGRAAAALALKGNLR